MDLILKFTAAGGEPVGKVQTHPSADGVNSSIAHRRMGLQKNDAVLLYVNPCFRIGGKRKLQIPRELRFEVLERFYTCPKLSIKRWPRY